MALSKLKSLERRKVALAVLGSASEPYSPLRLSIEMDSIATWIKRHRPNWTPEKLAEELWVEVRRIQDEMTDGAF